MILVAIIIIVVLVLIFYVTTYNSLVSLRNKVKNQWSQIDVQLKERADLIPNLVETIKGYAKHEKTTLDDVIKARNSFNNASSVSDKVKTSGELDGVLNRLFALTEAYPDLKANENFIQLQNNLREIEDKIRITRQFYNDTVLTYNNKIETIPSNIVASISHFEKATFFEIKEEDKEVPNVSF